MAVLVAQRHRQTVDFGLADDLHRLVFIEAEEAAHPGDELDHVAVVEGVAERQHRPGMGDLPEAGGRRSADLFRRAVAARQVGEGGLDGLQAAAQRVVVGVGDPGCVVLVISLVVGGDFLSQGVQFSRRFQRRQRVNGDTGGDAGVIGVHGPAPSSRLSAAARASSVILAPASMRAISSLRPLSDSASTVVNTPGSASDFDTSQ